MNNRAYSLDALRGFAILTMVLSGALAWGVLPGWMYHAQVGPRSNFQFDPSVYGITWVDLVFPFFLFAMGAAFSFSIGKKIEKGEVKLYILKDLCLRGVKLTFFAVFIQHMYPFVLSSPQDYRAWLISIMAFILMFPMFMRIPAHVSKSMRCFIKLIAYILAVVMMLTVSYANNRTFSLGYSNIIILVLANMAFWGGVIYLVTYKKVMLRLLILPLLMGVILSSRVDGSWAKSLYEFSPLPWLYQFNYLKYLFIVIPGTIAGDYLACYLKKTFPFGLKSDANMLKQMLLLLVSLLIIIVNLYCLYMRFLTMNLFLTISLLTISYCLLRSDKASYIYKIFRAGAFFLILGLCYESFEGGIRKDYATFSYYFVTSGLAFFAMIIFHLICDVHYIKSIVQPLISVGQNPMLAYATPQLLILPVLNIIGIYPYFSYLDTSPWLGFLRGVIITSLTIGITFFCTYKKWLWRT